MRKFVSVLLLFVFVAVSMTYAEDIYVKAGASGKGNKDAPYGYLWKALDKAKRGDVIHVAAGTYNGKSGCGAFDIKVPELTLVGGYNADFSERNPFKHLTILERAKDYRGDWQGLPEGIIAGSGDHSNLIVDGLVLNGQSRNDYSEGGSINFKKSYMGRAFQAESADIKIRNCIIINPAGEGIYCTWSGKHNEISNTFVVNTFYNGISTRSAQPNSEIRIKNCTIAFCWFFPSKGGGISVFVGRQGKTIMENNIFAMSHTEGGEAGFGVTNTFGNDETVMKDNVFYRCPGGYYKYMDAGKKNLLVAKPEELKELNEEAEANMLAEASGNAEEDPQLTPDEKYFTAFGNFVESKVEDDKGSQRQNYGMAYPLEAVVPNLVSKLDGKGVQANGPFAEYKSKAVATGKEYKEAQFAAFAKDRAKTWSGQAVSFKAGLGTNATSWLLKNVERKDYDCVKLNAPGESEPTRNYVMGYLLKGSEAAKNWAKYLKKKEKYAAEGVTIRGTAWYAGSDTYSYPVCVVIDEVIAK